MTEVPPPAAAPPRTSTPPTSDSPPPAVARFLTAEDVGAVLGITSRGARLLLERGELPGFRLGRRWYLRPEDLDRAVAGKIADRRLTRDAGLRVYRGLPALPRGRKP